ncbi:MAG: peptidylprolyl isomerase [Alphaproteobacteria bacterium]|nr:peptidylprolyl isomerase [Alphaproteobacteria bacterium]
MSAFCRSCALLLVLVGIAAAAGPAESASRRNAPSRAAPAGQPAPQPGPPPETRIAAVVNDEVISMFDVVSRIKMVMASSNLPDTVETRQRIAGQVLRTIVDEKLEMQEAKRQNITATDDEVNKALAQIEKQNNMKPGQLDDFLKARGIDKSALVDQLTASIVWTKLVRRQASQGTEISDEEIDDAMKRLKEHANDPQSRVAEIFLAVDNPAQEEDVRKLAERLSDQMRKGTRFSAVAQQFSQSATAAVGGDIGWVRPDQLSPELGKVVAKLRPGELSDPIRTTGGFYLLLVVDRRTGTTGSSQDAVLKIVQVVFPLPEKPTDALKRTALAEAQAVRGAAKSCPEMLKIGKQKAPQLSSEGDIRVSEISPAMRNIVLHLPIGQASEPILQKNGVGVIMVCQKTEAVAAGEPTRDDVAESLLRQRLDTLARRYMRDLRRNAFVDVRV